MVGSHGLSAATIFFALSASLAASGYFHGRSADLRRSLFPRTFGDWGCVGGTAGPSALGAHVRGPRQVRISIGVLSCPCHFRSGMASDRAPGLATQLLVHGGARIARRLAPASGAKRASACATDEQPSKAIAVRGAGRSNGVRRLAGAWHERVLADKSARTADSPFGPEKFFPTGRQAGCSADNVRDRFRAAPESR